MNTCQKAVWSLLLVTLSLTSCIAQATTAQTNEAVVGEQSFTSKGKTLTKTQGTDAYQNVHCSLQDRHGNLWFGTTGEGVFRYDRKEFTQYTEKDGLSNNKVWSMLEDASGNIWFGTDNGISLYDGATISKIPFTRSGYGGFETPIAHSGLNAVWSIMQDKKGTIWFGTSNDLYCYDGKSFSRFLDQSNISNKQNLQLKWIQCMVEDSSGKIWMGSGPIVEEGVIQFDGKSITNSKPSGDGWIRYVVKGTKGDMWFSGRHNGVFHYDGETFNKFTEKTDIGSAIFKDTKGNLWFDGGEKLNAIESINGLWRYDGTIFTNFSSSDGMGKNSVWSMLEDRDGNIWIGTRNCGLYCFDGKKFTAFSE